MKTLILSFLLLLTSFGFSQDLSIERIQKFKKCTVRILINNNPVGTGFVISKDGWILTCFHVIASNIVRDSVTKRLTEKNKVEAEFFNKKRVEISIRGNNLSTNYPKCLAYDFAFLGIVNEPQREYPYLELGNFDNVNEGAEVYSIGYPLGISQPVVARGLLSTKFVDSARLFNIKSGGITDTIPVPRLVAWLDVTMNKGNSGGAVIRLGNTIDEDRVIGISTFILNPYANASEKVANLAGEIKKVGKTGMKLGGLDLVSIFWLYGRAIENNSVGVSGCITINYANSIK